MDKNILTPEGLRTWVPTDEAQNEIFDFTEMLRGWGSADKYLATVEAAEIEAKDINVAETLRALHLMFEPFYQAMPAGHDEGHALRDLLGALALTANDPFVNKGFKSDILAGLIGGAWHDMGNAFMDRYQDAKWRAGHGEAWAFAFYHLTEGVLPPNLRTLASYAILVHTDYKKPVKVTEPEGFERQPYWYGLEYTEEGRPYGLAILLTRFTDRLDNNGVTIAARDWLAKSDAVSNGGGADITADKWYEISGESVDISFQPVVAMLSTGDGKNAPTILQHLHNYAFSNFGLTVYSRDDHNFPTMVRLMTEKVHQTMSLRDTILGAGHVRTEAKKVDLYRLLHRVSLASDEAFDKSWAALEKAWDNLTPKVRMHWRPGIAYMDKAYDGWVNLLANMANQKSEYAELTEEIRKELLT